MKKARILSALMLSTIILAQVVPAVAQTQEILEAPETEQVVETPVAETPAPEQVEEVALPAFEVELPPVQEESVAEVLPEVTAPVVTLPELVSPTFSGQDVGVLSAGVEATFGERISLDSVAHLFPGSWGGTGAEAEIKGVTTAGDEFYHLVLLSGFNIEMFANSLFDTQIQAGKYVVTLPGTAGTGDGHVSFLLNINRAQAIMSAPQQIPERQYSGSSVASPTRLPGFSDSQGRQLPTGEAFDNLYYMDAEGNPTANAGHWRIGGVDVALLEEINPNHSFGHITEFFAPATISQQTIQLIGEPEPYDFGRQFNNDRTIDTSEVDFDLIAGERFRLEGVVSGEEFKLQVSKDHTLAFESPYADGNNRLVGTGFGIVGEGETRASNYRLTDSPARIRGTEENFIPVDVNKLLVSTTGIKQTEGVSVLPEKVSSSKDTIKVSALIDETVDHVAHERSEEVLADVQFTLYEENPADTRLRTIGISNDTGVFTGLEAGKQYYVTATSLASQNFESGVASEAVPVSTTSTTPRPPEGEAGGTDGENGGIQGNGTNDGNNQDNGNQDTEGQNVLKTSQKLPKVGDVATASVTLLGIGSLLTALGIKKKSKK